MKNSNLIFEEKKIDSKELIEMIERLPYEKKKTIYDMIKGYEFNTKRYSFKCWC